MGYYSAPTTTGYRFRILASTWLGGIVEMYDFVVYIFLSPIIAEVFFPKTDPHSAILMTFGIFAIGYFSRPIGGILFGHLVDRIGRRRGLIASVFAMSIAIFLTAIVPGYQTIGIAAPILLLIFRLLQGLSVGGEFPTALVFLAENSDVNKRGWFTSWLFCGINFGTLLGSAVVALFHYWLDPAQLQSWGWRIPFLAGALLAIFGFYVRNRLLETPIFIEHLKKYGASRLPIKTLLQHNWWPLIIGIGLVCLMSIIIGALYLNMPMYLHALNKISMTEALWANTISLLIFSLFIPVFGLLSDKLGRKTVLLSGTVLIGIFCYGLFYLLKTPNIIAFGTGLLILSLFSAMVVGPLPVILTELFPTHIRATGAAMTYNISFGVFGGLAPLVIAKIYGSTHNLHDGPTFYLIFGAIVTLIAVLLYRETKGKIL